MSEESKTSQSMRTAKLRKRAPALIVAAGVGIVILLVVALRGRDTTKPPGPTAAVPVEVEVVRPIPLMGETFDLLGKVEADRVVDVAGEVAARVIWVNPNEGKAIKQGDEIIKLNTDLLQADHDRAEAMAEYERGELKRIITAHKQSVATDRELDLARAKAEATKADFDAAKACLDRATIRAPIDGTLEKVFCEEGTYCSPGTVVARIVDTDPAKVVVNVPERDVGNLEPDREEKILAKDRDEALSGRVSFIGELADESTNTTRVEISVNNVPRVLRSGQIVLVRLLRKQHRNVILIPVNAVVPLEEGKAIYVVDKDGNAQRRDNVETGFFTGGEVQKVQILNGLRDGDRVIVKGQRYVSPGKAVNVVHEDDPKPPATQPLSKG